LELECPLGSGLGLGLDLDVEVGLELGSELFRPTRSFDRQSRLLCDTLGQRAHLWCWWLSNCPCSDYISHRC